MLSSIGFHPMMKNKRFDEDDEENLYEERLLDDDGVEFDDEDVEGYGEYSELTADDDPNGTVEPHKRREKDLSERDRLAQYGLVERKNGHYADNAKMYECMVEFKQKIYEWQPGHDKWQIRQEACNLYEELPRKCEKKFFTANEAAIRELASTLTPATVREIRAEPEPPRPDIPRYLAECFIKIPTHLCYRPNFSGYTYKEEFIADAIEAEIKYVVNFDETRFKNPFAYFTQICWQSFVRRIQLEKQQSIIKGMYLKNIDVAEEFSIDPEIGTGLQDDSFKSTHVYVKMAVDEEYKREKAREEREREKAQRLYEKNHSSALEEFLG